MSPFVSDADIAALRAGGAFDEAWYCESYRDVRASGLDPAVHYLWLGRKLGRSPNASYQADGKVNRKMLPSVAERSVPTDRGFASWLANYDFDPALETSLALEYVKGLAHRPLISVIVPTYNTPEVYLRAAIDSVRAQVYENWELCIADDCSPDESVRKIIQDYAEKDSRIRYVFREKNGNISEATNSALSIARGEWIAFLDHDDIVYPHALLMVVEFINKNKNAKIFYSDEDKITLDGRRDGPYFKCDWNRELFYSHNLITHLAVYHRDLVDKVGGLRKDFDGAQDYDFALRASEQVLDGQICHIPYVLYGWRMIPGSTALSSDEKPYAMLAGERALNAHFERMHIRARSELTGFGYRTRYELGEVPPFVSIVIPTRNGLGITRNCIESIFNRSTYKNFEIVLLDNGSDDFNALHYFDKISKDLGVVVVRDDGPFNYSAINNYAVRHCRGEYLILLNNDIEVVAPDWIEEMVSRAMQPDVGAVGAKLLYPDGRVQHGGVVMGLGGLAAHAHTLWPADSTGFAGRLALASQFSAVTAACLAVRRSTFLAIGGLDEENLAIAYNDVDFCLRLQEKGLRNVYTPYAVLYHHESATRGPEHENPEKLARFHREQGYMCQRWRSVIDYDPAYSPNLTWDNTDFHYAFPPRVDLPWRGSAA